MVSYLLNNTIIPRLSKYTSMLSVIPYAFKKINRKVEVVEPSFQKQKQKSIESKYEFLLANKTQ